MLSVEDLSAGYGARPVIHHISFSAQEGEFIALLGQNGSGKVTIFTFERRALFTWRLVHIRLPGDERQG